MSWVETEPGETLAPASLRRAPVALYTTAPRNGRLAEIVLNIRPTLMRKPPRWLARFGAVRVFAGRGENVGQIRVVPGGQIVVQGSPGRAGSAPAVVVRITHLPVLAYHPSPVEVEFVHTADDLVVLLPPWLCPPLFAAAPAAAQPTPPARPPARTPPPAFPAVPRSLVPPRESPAQVQPPAVVNESGPAVDAWGGKVDAQGAAVAAQAAAAPAELVFAPPAPLPRRAKPSGEDDDDEGASSGAGDEQEDTPEGGADFPPIPLVAAKSLLHPLNPMVGLLGRDARAAPPACPRLPMPATLSPAIPRPVRSPGFSMLEGSVIPTRRL